MGVVQSVSSKIIACYVIIYPFPNISLFLIIDFILYTNGYFGIDGA